MITSKTFYPAANGDDGYGIINSTFANTGNEILWGRIQMATRSFFRFPNVTIPKGVTIESAYLKLTVSSRYDTVETYVAANAADNPSAPTTSASLHALTLTSAVSAKWSQVGTSTDVQYTSPDIKTVIQELIDRAGWASGNAMMIIVYDDGDTNDYSYVYGYDAGSKYAQLEITYSSPDSGLQVVWWG